MHIFFLFIFLRKQCLALHIDDVDCLSGGHLTFGSHSLELELLHKLSSSDNNTIKQHHEIYSMRLPTL